MITTGVLLLVYLVFSREKTLAALKIALRMFVNLLPSFLTVLFAVALVLAALPSGTLERLLGDRAGFAAYGIAALLGSVALIPGFVAYPLAAVLIGHGVGYPVIAVFITTLMMVGVMTLPLEKAYFGWRVAVARNLLCLAGALAIGAGIALVWRIL